jgi:V/A-type H+-transporting ATPase subunit A
LLSYYYQTQDAVKKDVELKKLFSLPVREKIGRAKYIPQERMNAEFDLIEQELASQIDALLAKEGE